MIYVHFVTSKKARRILQDSSGLRFWLYSQDMGHIGLFPWITTSLRARCARGDYPKEVQASICQLVVMYTHAQLVPLRRHSQCYCYLIYHYLMLLLLHYLCTTPSITTSLPHATATPSITTSYYCYLTTSALPHYRQLLSIHCIITLLDMLLLLLHSLLLHYLMLLLLHLSLPHATAPSLPHYRQLLSIHCIITLLDMLLLLLHSLLLHYLTTRLRTA